MTVHLRGLRLLRRRRPQSVAITLVAGLIALSAAGCNGSAKSTGSGTGGTLTIGIARDLGSLNPAVDSGLSGGDGVVYLPYATLVNRDPVSGALEPGLAQSYGYVGTGNTTYQLKLRPNLKFADGSPLDADAVKTWFNYFPTAPGTTLGGFIQIASIDTPDDLTVRIHLKTPTPLVTEYLSSGWGMVVSPKAVANPSQISAGAPGAGPYVYEPSKTVTGTGATYTLVPNKYFYDQSQIKWSKIVLKVISDPATMLRSVQSGQIDVAEGSVTTLAAAKSAGLHTDTAPGGFAGVTIIDSNGTKVKALGDVRVRQALNYAIDRDAIAKSLFQGAVEPASAPVLSDVSDASLQNYYSYDPAKAKQLLAEAGYPNGFSFGIVAPTFGTLVGAPLMQAIAQNWADIGVTAKVVAPTTTTELYAKFLSQSAYMIDVTDVPVVTLGQGFLPSGVTNVYKVDYGKIVKLLDQAATAPQNQQAQLREEILKEWVTQAYSVPIAATTNLIYWNDKVTGVKASKFTLQAPAPWAWAPSS